MRRQEARSKEAGVRRQESGSSLRLRACQQFGIGSAQRPGVSVK